METLKVLFPVDRETAILAGNSEYGEVTLKVNPAELTETQRKTLLRFNYLSSCAYNLTRSPDITKRNKNGIRCHSYSFDPPKFAEASVANVAALLDYTTKRLAEAEAEANAGWAKEAEEQRLAKEKKHQEIAAWLAIPNEQLANEFLERHKNHCSSFYPPQEFYPYNDKAEIKNKAAKIDVICKQLRKDREEKIARAEAKLKKQRQDQLNKWVLQFGTDSQKKRHERRFLDEEEILKTVRENVFAPIAKIAERYKKLKAQQIYDLHEYQPEEYCEYDPCRFEVYTEEVSLSDSEFETLEKIETACKELDAGIEARSHLGGFEHSEKWSVKANSALVTIKINGWKFSREFALGEPKDVRDRS